MRRLPIGVPLAWWAGVCLTSVVGVSCTVDEEDGSATHSVPTSVRPATDEPAGVPDGPGPLGLKGESVSEGLVPAPSSTTTDGTPTPPPLVSSRWSDTDVADPTGELDGVTIAVTNDADERLDVEVNNWMNFFWNWHTVTANKVTMAEIYDVIRGACGGWCTIGDEIGWGQMVGAAMGKWGWGSAKYNYFVLTGANTGVDN